MFSASPNVATGVAREHYELDADGKPKMMNGKPILDYKDYGMGRGGVSFVGQRTATANNPPQLAVAIVVRGDTDTNQNTPSL